MGKTFVEKVFGNKAGKEVRAYDMMKFPGWPDVLTQGAASTTLMTNAIIFSL
ncbi:MAG: hypothetical protein KAT17_02675 [Candidatus Aminicenantes bacterium]|nr:hypothetical protein [Candidatus Aminicenantes bacterium]